MAKSTRQYVFEGMELLPAALIPFVEKRLESSLKGHWQVQVLEKLPGKLLTRDQLIMLHEDNVGNPEPANNLFGMKPISFREGIAAYLQRKM